MLEEIESVDQVPAFLRQAKRDPQAFRRLGFGNSRYRHRDPRADILRETSHRVLAEGRHVRPPAAGGDGP